VTLWTRTNKILLRERVLRPPSRGTRNPLVKKRKRSHLGGPDNSTCVGEGLVPDTHSLKRKKRSSTTGLAAENSNSLKGGRKVKDNSKTAFRALLRVRLASVKTIKKAQTYITLWTEKAWDNAKQNRKGGTAVHRHKRS